MEDVLIYGDTERSQEMRHEVAVMIPDPFLYAERDGVRHVVGSSFEQPRLGGIGPHEFHPFEEFGLDELRRTSSTYGEAMNALAVRAVLALGIERAIVPSGFPVLTADLLRAAGVELIPDQVAFDDRRRVKTPAELAGVRRAQRAAEAGMTAAVELLRQSVPNAGGKLEVDGEVLTSERIKVAIAAAFLANGAGSDEFVVSHGAQAAIGHHMGSGEILAGETIVIDIWPRDNESSCFADMTRTFVVGEVPAEVAEWHRLCKEAVDRSVAEIRPGAIASSIYDGTCDVFEAAGYPTLRTKADGETLDNGFLHSLGHGVGLAVHEEPFLGRIGKTPLVAGDVITVEPGLYRPGFGGLRLEDLILVTDDGAETLTQFPYDLAP
ncbi:MAG TPA: Xaa-Pro peptidase family protein [Gaiellaceae bacterium]|jgi:Xaa-Pro aminopeptidase